MEEQREYLKTRHLEPEKRRGKAHFRRGFCSVGCSAFALHQTLRGRGMGSTLDTLKRACGACELASEPDREAVRVEVMWHLPDDALHLADQPHHFVAGVALLRLRNGRPF